MCVYTATTFAEASSDSEVSQQVQEQTLLSLSTVIRTQCPAQLVYARQEVFNQFIIVGGNKP